MHWAVVGGSGAGAGQLGQAGDDPPLELLVGGGDAEVVGVGRGLKLVTAGEPDHSVARRPSPSPPARRSRSPEPAPPRPARQRLGVPAVAPRGDRRPLVLLGLPPVLGPLHPADHLVHPGEQQPAAHPRSCWGSPTSTSLVPARAAAS